MSLITTIIDGIAPNPSSGLGGANEGHIQGFQDDIITGVAGGVADKAGGQCLVTQNSPLGMNVLVADGVVYIPNADYIANLATATKYYRVVMKAEDPVTIPSNTSGSDCQHGLDVVVDKVTVPNEYASNIATLVITLGTPGAGAPAVPDNGYRLAEVEVVDGATQIANASITDSRTQIAINDVVLSTNVVTKTATQTLSQKTLTSPVINTSFSGTAKATASEVATGTDDTKIVTPKGIKDAGIVAITKGAGSDITTGTDDAKYITSKALADAGVNTRLKTKVKQISRDLTAASGNVSYTGIGFTPSAIISMAGLGADITSIGVSDSAKGGLLMAGGPTWATNTGAVGATLGLYSTSGGNYQTWNVYSYDADGFTLTWSKTGSPTGTLYISFLCFG